MFWASDKKFFHISERLPSYNVPVKLITAKNNEFVGRYMLDENGVYWMHEGSYETPYLNGEIEEEVIFWSYIED